MYGSTPKECKTLPMHVIDSSTYRLVYLQKGWNSVGVNWSTNSEAECDEHYIDSSRRNNT